MESVSDYDVCISGLLLVLFVRATVNSLWLIWKRFKNNILNSCRPFNSDHLISPTGWSRSLDNHYNKTSTITLTYRHGSTKYSLISRRSSEREWNYEMLENFCLTFLDEIISRLILTFIFRELVEAFKWDYPFGSFSSSVSLLVVLCLWYVSCLWSKAFYLWIWPLCQSDCDVMQDNPRLSRAAFHSLLLDNPIWCHTLSPYSR